MSSKKKTPKKPSVKALKPQKAPAKAVKPTKAIKKTKEVKMAKSEKVVKQTSTEAVEQVTAQTPTPAQPAQEDLMGLDPTVLEFLRKQHIYFGLPMYGGMCTEATFTGLLRFAVIATKLKLNFTMDVLYNESLIPRARNNLVAKFLNTDATHLMFIDVDLGFDPESILKLLCNNQDIIGGLYPKKALPISYAVNAVPSPQILDKDIIEVSTLATGFMLIKRHVIEQMIQHHPELKIKDGVGYAPECEKYMYALFDSLIDENQNYLSEDWTFCYRWRKMGGHVFANTSIKLDHSGFYKFPGNIEAIKRAIG